VRSDTNPHTYGDGYSYCNTDNYAHSDTNNYTYRNTETYSDAAAAS
jgi:hypothetical protein